VVDPTRALPGTSQITPEVRATGSTWRIAKALELLHALGLSLDVCGAAHERYGAPNDGRRVLVSTWLAGLSSRDLDHVLAQLRRDVQARRRASKQVGAA